MITCGCSSSGRAPPCQGGGSEFEPRQPLQKENTCHRQVFSFWNPGKFNYFWTAKPPKSGRGHSAAARFRSQALRSYLCCPSRPEPHQIRPRWADLVFMDRLPPRMARCTISTCETSQNASTQTPRRITLCSAALCSARHSPAISRKRQRRAHPRCARFFISDQQLTGAAFPPSCRYGSRRPT